MHQHSQRPNLQSNDHELYDVIELVAITMMSLRLSPARVLCSGRHREGAVREGPCSEVAAMHREGEVEVFDPDDTFGKKDLFMDHFVYITRSPHPPPPRFASDYKPPFIRRWHHPFTSIL